MIPYSLPAFRSNRRILAFLAAVLISAIPHCAQAQAFRILDVARENDGSLRLTHEASPDFYYRLLRGDRVDAITQPADMALGVTGNGSLRDRQAPSATAFYKVARVPIAQPLDGDHDGIDDAYELLHAPALDPLNGEDALRGDPANGGLTYLDVYRREHQPLATVAESSPQAGESEVSVTRETVLNFSRPLAADTKLTGDIFFATYAGRHLLSRVELGGDRRKASLFYLENLPASARVRVTLLGEGLKDDLGRSVDLDGDGVAGGNAVFEFDTTASTPVVGTAVIGHVFASELGTDGLGKPVNRPLAGVTVTVDGAEETVRTTTDASGFFSLSPAPAGRFFVHVDGRTAIGSQWPGGAYYPFVGKAWEAVAGVTTNLASGTGEIFLPLVPAGSLQTVSATRETPITFVPETLAANPALEGVEIRVPANALFSDDGTRGGKVGIAPVPPDRLPEPLPEGLKLPLVITIQTDGPGNFDQPVPVRFPNLPDPVTGKKLAPGAKSALWSFDHDTGRWEVIGPMTVSDDGKFVDTDPGVGVRKPSWHGSQPGTRGKGKPPIDRKKLPCLDGQGHLKGTFNPNQCLGNVAVGTGAGVGAGFVIKYLDTLSGKVFNGTDTVSKGLKKLAGKVIKYEKKAFDGGDPNALAQRGYDLAELCKECARILIEGEDYPTPDPSDPTPNEAADILDQARRLANDFTNFDDLQEDTLKTIGSANSDAELTPGQLAHLAELVGKLDQFLGAGTMEDYFAPRIARLLARTETLYQFLISQGAPHFSPPSPGQFALKNLSNGLTTNGRTDGNGGIPSLILGPKTRYQLTVVFGDIGARTVVDFVSGDNGQITDIPRGVVDYSTLPDTDGDGLDDFAEAVYGTDPNNPDSNGDGIPDGESVRQGIDPLGDPARRSGILAAVQVPGTIIDVSADNQRIVTAEGAEGITILTPFNGLAPQRVAQVDTPGAAQRISASGTWVAVADGPAGLAVVDVSDPPASRIARQLALGDVVSVAADGDIAFAGLADGQVVAVNMRNGVTLAKVGIGSAIKDLSVSGDYLYALTDGRLHSLSWVDGDLQARGSAESPWFAIPNNRLFAGGGFAWAVHNKGFNTFSLADPAHPVLLAARNTASFGWKQIIPNGNGLGIAATDPNYALDGPNDIDIYDLGNPTDQGGFLARFPTPGLALALAYYRGLAYVGDSPAGLQVLNPVPFDNKRIPPTVALSANQPNGVEEGKLYRLTATAKDDVQVREVEFYVNDQLANVDGAFPFEVSLTAPRFDGVTPNNRLRLRARAIDTGGNAAWSQEIVVPLLADKTPPRVVNYTPVVACLAGGEVRSLSVTFSEPVNTATLAGAFRLFGAGPDGVPGTADDTEVTGGSITYNGDANRAELALPAPLPADSYRAVVGPNVADLRGNKAPVFEWLFSNLAECRAITVNTAVAADDLSLEGADVIVSGATLTLAGAHHFRSLVVAEGGVLTHPPGSSGGLDLAVDNSAVIEKTGLVTASSRGFGPRSGPGGAGNLCCGQLAGGGGHGGFGGYANGAGGAAYGLPDDPAEFGSGGGSLDFRDNQAGAGGGLIRLEVGKLLRLDGRLEADGGAATYACGAGAGGGIKVKAAVFAGGGTISASGGTAAAGGGGGGGRIALYSGQNAFTGLVAANGGGGNTRGGAGTIYRQTPGGSDGELLVYDLPGAQNYTGIAPLPAGLARLRIENGFAELDGDQTVANLVVGRGGYLTHPAAGAGLRLIVAGDATVEEGGFLTADSRGYGPLVGPGATGNVCCSQLAGGGGHGGFGGYGAPAPGGVAYGSVAQPDTLGSGGGTLDFRTTQAGSGGGALRLDVGGVLRVNGRLTADGGGATYACGGGAGGSLWLKFGKLEGSGLISASGGTASAGGGGGGGRIALYYSQDGFAGTVAAYGGGGNTRGGAGTVYRQATGAAGGDLAVYDAADPQSRTGVAPLPDGLVNLRIEKAIIELEGDQTLGNLTVARGGYLTHPAAGTGLHLIVAGDATVEEGGFLSVDSRGHGPLNGPGAAGNVCCSQIAGGGGHGGFGGYGAPAPGGVAYGSVAQPDTLGSGGGTLDVRTSQAGSGGGALRLDVGGVLRVNGRLTADGGGATYACGGGAGGSLWLKFAKLEGSGLISASGGTASAGGGGGGGRIALYYRQDGFAGTVAAYGGGGYTRGGAGTVYRQVAGAAGGDLAVYDVADPQNRTGVAPLPAGLANLRIENGIVELDGDQTLGNLTVARGGLLTHPAGGPGLHLIANGALTVDAGGSLSADSRGYGPLAGPGTAGNVCCSQIAGGGGHGGFGGYGNGAGGAAYGSVAQPDTLGSGGGTLDVRTSQAGSGGGAIRLDVGGPLVVNGRLSANGGGATYACGGGAGGSLWLKFGKLEGTGLISASGGTASAGGGGGGGRIALYFAEDRFAGSLEAYGGGGNTRGGAGTVYRQANGAALGELSLLDRPGAQNYTGVATVPDTLAKLSVANAFVQFDPINKIGSIEVEAGGLAAFSGTIAADSVRVGAGGTLAHRPGEAGFHLKVQGDLVVSAQGAVSADFLGYGPRSGPGAAGNVCCGQFAGGAGYGGLGGSGTGGGAGGPVYGIEAEPVDLGSGGGTLDVRDFEAGRGGGAVRFTVNGLLRVDGRISSNGGNAIGNAGAGSGGSLWIATPTLAGTGAISADGGSADGAGGGGGRVALYTRTLTFTGPITANGGASLFVGAGGLGSVFQGLLP